MFTFAIDYYLMVLVASIGAIQFAASASNLRGLLFIKRPVIARGLGLVVVAFAFVWFFSVAERNVGDHTGALDSNSQAIFFLLGVISGGALTFVVSSVINQGMRAAQGVPEAGAEQGMDALRQLSFYNALAANLHYWWNNWRTQIRRYLFG